MKGHVPTPELLVDQMVESLFHGLPPRPTDCLLDPGCADGAFIEGVLRWCRSHGVRPPRIIGVELNPSLVDKARRRFAGVPSVRIKHADYLAGLISGPYRYVVGNPPYVSITKITPEQRARYRAKYRAARGRFDLYLLFYERALSELAPGGRLVFVTPEKYLYVETAAPLREMIAEHHVESIELVDEDIFTEHVVYPAITVVRKAEPGAETRTLLRDGESRRITIPQDGQSWLPLMRGCVRPNANRHALSDYCLRVSAGIATGADDVFVRPIDSISAHLKRFARPALRGRDLDISARRLPSARHSLLLPYSENGILLEEPRLGALGTFLRRPENKKGLMARTCVAKKPWYAFHDSCPLPDILRPKILCKDIGQRPRFWVDRAGSVVPLHSIYYIVPSRTEYLSGLCDWLNGPEAADWLDGHCQRASNGFIRLQSHVLKALPVPATLFEHRAARAA